MVFRIPTVQQAIQQMKTIDVTGEVHGVRGLLIECRGLNPFVAMGSRCYIHTREHKAIIAEVVGVETEYVLLMPYGDVMGIGKHCPVTLLTEKPMLRPHASWVGRIINALGEPIDEKGPLALGSEPYDLRAGPPPAHRRKRVKGKVDLGIRALNSFVTCCRGQRLGIFAGSGVGKSMLMSMLTRYAHTDVKVIGLIGERGREVQEFLEEYLGEEGLKNAVIIVATGDEPPIMRKQAAYVTMTVAEYFRDQGSHVMCLMDSVTRFAMAQREIGLAAGEPPTTKGYTPTVFAELAKLLERAGPGTTEGDITGLFSVLVDGDDHNEPIADAVRGILDGHIVLERAIAERGRFPAINILKSVSRTLPGCNISAENQLIARARQLLSTYDDMAEMIRLGAYRKGSNPEVDEAINYVPKLENYLKQAPDESTSLEEGYNQLATLLDIHDWKPQNTESTEAAH